MRENSNFKKERQKILKSMNDTVCFSREEALVIQDALEKAIKYDELVELLNNAVNTMQKKQGSIKAEKANNPYKSREACDMKNSLCDAEAAMLEFAIKTVSNALEHTNTEKLLSIQEPDMERE